MRFPLPDMTDFQMPIAEHSLGSPAERIGGRTKLAGGWTADRQLALLLIRVSI